MAKGPASSASCWQQELKQSTKKSLRRGQTYYYPFTKYLPILQQFAAQGFPEPDVVSLYMVVIGSLFFSLSSAFLALFELFS